MFDPNQRDNVSDATIRLRKRLLTLGYSLETAGDRSLEDCAWVFFHDAPSVEPYRGWLGAGRRLKTLATGKRPARRLFRECLRADMQSQMVLFLWEPPSTTPENFKPRIHERFPIVFTWHDGLVDGRKFHKIWYPQPFRFPGMPDIPFDQRKVLVNISANKISFHPRELYSARRATIRHFERYCPEGFDLYGVGWDYLPIGVLRELWPIPVHRYSSYRGTVPHKWDVLPRYRFGICYENIRDEPGYVTEKIFDSMRCGCVPIYWGASNIADYLDPEAFVDRRKFGSDRELEEYICGVDERKYARYQEAMQSYLHSDRFELFLPSNYIDTIVGVLGL